MSFFYEVISNNPRIKSFPNCTYIEGPVLDVLIALRDKVHRGYRILSHPLTGNLPASRRLFLSVVVFKPSLQQEDHFVDLDSIKLVESALDIYRNSKPSFPLQSTKAMEDMQYLDEELIMPVLRQCGITSQEGVH